MYVKSGGPVSQIHYPYRHAGSPGIFLDLLTSVQMLKRECGVASNGKLPHIFVPSNSSTLVREFELEDLLLGRTAVNDLPIDRTHDDVLICVERFPKDNTSSFLKSLLRNCIS